MAYRPNVSNEDQRKRNSQERGQQEVVPAVPDVEQKHKTNGEDATGQGDGPHLIMDFGHRRMRDGGFAYHGIPGQSGASLRAESAVTPA